LIWLSGGGAHGARAQKRAAVKPDSARVSAVVVEVTDEAERAPEAVVCR